MKAYNDAASETNGGSRLRREGRSNSLAAVDDDVLRPDASLEHAHLGVVSTATE